MPTPLPTPLPRPAPALRDADADRLAEGLRRLVKVPGARAEVERLCTILSDADLGWRFEVTTNWYGHVDGIWRYRTAQEVSR